jgi:hypothetical protein
MCKNLHRNTTQVDFLQTQNQTQDAKNTPLKENISTVKRAPSNRKRIHQKE